ncbi:restriction endonuclease subunit S [Clostridium gasigenes]|uniref:restriction endonuclease subunit S n=1 Tax=Clostridium gasigenes TaxID=94869 RepID=UPI001C0CA457|nr:restriction endonuclease subunit S [Clostridium gasigenes]MBU3103926.1 restriction endonuclease subunit S [Clostridium gasigenes]
MKLVNLGEIFKINSGGTPLKSNQYFYENGNIPWIKTGDLKPKYINKSSDYITELAVEKSSAKLFPKETVLIAMYGATIGATSILKINSTTNQACAAFLPTNKVMPEYLYYFFKANNEKIISLGVGGAQPNISGAILKSIRFPLIKLYEQNKIVEILDKANELIDKRKEQIEALDELVKSRFIEMFKDLKGEKHLSLEECTDFIDYRGKTPVLSESGIRIINAKSVGNGFFKYIDEHISEDTFNYWMKRGFPVAGDVLFVTEGHTFGNVCRIPRDLKKFAMGQRVITIQGKKEILNNAFLSQYMQMQSFKIEIDKYKTGSSAQGIRSKELKKVLIPIPRIEIQNAFDRFVNQSDKLKFEMESSLKELEDNFNSLMQKAFKGQLL